MHPIAPCSRSRPGGLCWCATRTCAFEVKDAVLPSFLPSFCLFRAIGHLLPTVGRAPASNIGRQASVQRFPATTSRCAGTEPQFSTDADLIHDLSISFGRTTGRQWRSAIATHSARHARHQPHLASPFDNRILPIGHTYSFLSRVLSGLCCATLSLRSDCQSVRGVAGVLARPEPRGASAPVCFGNTNPRAVACWQGKQTVPRALQEDGTIPHRSFGYAQLTVPQPFRRVLSLRRILTSRQDRSLLCAFARGRVVGLALPADAAEASASRCE